VVSPFKPKLTPVIKVVAGPPPPDPTDHAAFQVTWRDRSEREFIQRWAKYYYHEHFQRRLPPEEDWLLFDITILSKRLIDHMRLIECTFNLKNIIRVCSEFMYFLWKDISFTKVLTDNPLFESQVFHILTLLNFAVFPFNVTEKFLHGHGSTATPPTEPTPPPAAAPENDEKE